MKITLILKGILFYTEALLVLVFTGSIDSIFDKSIGLVLILVVLITMLGYICMLIISEEDLKTITLYKYIPFKEDE